MKDEEGEKSETKRRAGRNVARMLTRLSLMAPLGMWHATARTWKPVSVGLISEVSVTLKPCVQCAYALRTATRRILATALSNSKRGEIEAAV